ncbi:hypothetical protein L596_014457 [Steinernema carpocapsae]|uniref:Protein-tyrosine-phosphatase n=1 Tax=Steinernema carpocapsae TaxID=34508 RepID=A0A4V6A2U0_STECR|nr:hypothetical protein L596_014457 [Steinernema carpocapsae]
MRPSTLESEFFPDPKDPRRFARIRDYFFICGYGTVRDNEKILKEHGITHVVDCANLVKARKAEDVEYLHIAVQDFATEDISKFFHLTADFIERAVRGVRGIVCAYCAAGVSRSATICLMYLVIKEKLNLREAFRLVHRARPIICPNLGFWHQMIDYEKEHNDGKATVKIIFGSNGAHPDVYPKCSL